MSDSSTPSTSSGTRPTTQEIIDAYLARLGLDAAPDVSAKGLRAIQEAHLRAVPFENLSVHRQELLPLKQRAFATKVAFSTRGGICYELNGALCWLLRKLGFNAALASARVWSGGELSHPGDHMLVLVTLDSRKGDVRIADVGFGAHAVKPLRLNRPGPQHDVTGDYTVQNHGRLGWDVLHGDVPAYRIEPGSRTMKDFRACYWYHFTCPDSRFTQRTVCSRPTEDGRVTISNDELTLTEAGEKRVEVLSAAELLAAYRDYFGIDLDDVPTVLHPPAELTG